MQNIRLHHSDSLEFLSSAPKESYDLIYIDPPFNTGNTQISRRDPEVSYSDALDKHEYVQFMSDRLRAARELLKESGSIYVHLDYRSVFDVKLVLDSIFGAANFLNHIIWSYNYGGRGKKTWPKKHDDILFYSKSCGKHYFAWDDIERIPYKAPEMQYVGRTRDEAEERIKRGQVPTDVWDIPIVGINSHERTGYPTQKPIALLKRIISASCPIDGHVLDFFAGSGTTGIACAELNRNCTLVDKSVHAINVMKNRFAAKNITNLECSGE